MMQRTLVAVAFLVLVAGLLILATSRPTTSAPSDAAALYDFQVMQFDTSKGAIPGYTWHTHVVFRLNRMTGEVCRFFEKNEGTMTPSGMRKNWLCDVNEPREQ